MKLDPRKNDLLSAEVRSTLHRHAAQANSWIKYVINSAMMGLHRRPLPDNYQQLISKVDIEMSGAINERDY